MNISVECESVSVFLILDKIQKASRQQLDKDLKRINDTLLLEKISPNQFSKEVIKSLEAWRDAIVDEISKRDDRRIKYIKNKGL